MDGRMVACIRSWGSDRLVAFLGFRDEWMDTWTDELDSDIRTWFNRYMRLQSMVLCCIRIALLVGRGGDSCCTHGPFQCCPEVGAAAGTKCGNLKVKRPRHFNFDPRALLAMAVRAFIALARFPEFVSATHAEAPALASRALQQRAAVLLKRRRIVSGEECEAFNRAAAAVLDAAEAHVDDDLLLEGAHEVMRV